MDTRIHQLRRAQLELEQARDRYSGLYDFAPAAHLTLNAGGEILEANLSAGELLGLNRARLIHQRFSRFVLPPAQNLFHLFCRRVFDSGTRQSAELELLNARGLRLVAQVQGMRDATHPRRQCRLSLEDITERKRAEERIAQLNRVQTVLAGIDRAIAHIPDQQKLLDEVCRVAVEKGGFKLAWVGIVAPDGSVQPVAQAGATGYLEGIRVVTYDVPEGRGAVGTAIRENRTVVVEDTIHEASAAPWHDRLQRFGLQYAAAFPIRIAGKAAGSFQVYAHRPHFFDETELRLLTQVSDDISVALTAISELTARKQAEEALRRSEHNLTNFFNQAPVGLVWLSASGTILRANQAQLDLLGCPAEHYLGHSFTEFCVEPSRARELLERLAAKETVRNFQMSSRCRDGAIRHGLMDGVSFWNEDQFLYSSVFLRDVTERVELEREVLQVSEREQRRIAQDLHDGLGQLLAGTAHKTNSLQKDLAAKSPPEARQMRRILKLIYEAIAQARSLSHGLLPVEPESNGLMVALKSLARRTQSLFQIQCRFACRQPVLIADNAVATHLYRIAQEAVTNAIKHGKPGRIDISLTGTPERIQLAIKDNGAGMPPRPGRKPGMGLRIMRYRADVIGGSLSVQNGAGGGGAVVCTAPPSAEDAMKHHPKAARNND